jgi:hemerythrin-like domain-containing protein
MKRVKQLHPLSMEHHLSLSLAARAIRIARENNTNAIAELCQSIVAEYPLVWKKHFAREEDYIFKIYRHRSARIQELCDQLEQEHRQFDAFAAQMQAGNISVLREVLSKFGKLLKSHTRLEERELFPLISEALSEKELDGIYTGIS